MSAKELVGWRLLAEIEAEERDLRNLGFTEDEVAEAVEGGHDGTTAEQGGGLLEHLLGEEAMAERLRLMYEAEEQGTDEEDD